MYRNGVGWVRASEAPALLVPHRGRCRCFLSNKPGLVEITHADWPGETEIRFLGLIPHLGSS